MRTTSFPVSLELDVVTYAWFAPTHVLALPVSTMRLSGGHNLVVGPVQLNEYVRCVHGVGGVPMLTYGRTLLSLQIGLMMSMFLLLTNAVYVTSWLCIEILPTSDEGGGAPVACAMARSRRLRARAWSRCSILLDPVKLKRFAIGKVTMLSRTAVMGVACTAMLVT